MTATFLIDPSTLPERAEGVPWGQESIAIEFAGRRLSIEGLSSRQLETARGLYGDFAAAPGSEPSTTVSVFRIDAGVFRTIDTRGWSYELDFDYGPASTRMSGMDLIGRIEWEDQFSAALWVATEAPETFHGAFENFLRVLTAHALLFARGALVHSAAVLEGRGARLFVGRSGAGKSTVSRLALDSGRGVVSDDLNLVVSDASLAGSPFLGDVGSRAAGRFPLLGIYRLEKASSDAIRPLSEGEALATLVACTPFVNRSHYLEDRLIENLTALARTVPAYTLSFRREGSFWPLLESC